MGPDREQYLAKRMELLNGPVHLVEIDLLRGPFLAGSRPARLDSVLVSRAQTRPNAEFWPIALRERLPVIPIPVRDPDSDARLNLQAVLDQIYGDAGYADYACTNKNAATAGRQGDKRCGLGRGEFLPRPARRTQGPQQRGSTTASGYHRRVGDLMGGRQAESPGLGGPARIRVAILRFTRHQPGQRGVHGRTVDVQGCTTLPVDPARALRGLS